MRSTQILLQSLRIKQLSKSHINNNVEINGWINSVRKLKNVAFADVSDGTCSKSLMVVMSPTEGKKLNTGSCVSINGIVKQSPGKEQDLEMELNSLKIMGSATNDYPLQKKYHSPEFLRSLPQYRWKTGSNAAVLRYRSFAQQQFQRYFNENDFVQVSSPLITSSDCEGAGEVFKVSSPSNPDFWKQKQAYLTVSSQLHLEVYTAALSRVWNMTPAFRAEESDTNRHLSEFWMVEAELAFTKELDDVMKVAEDMMKSAVPQGEAANDLLMSIRDDDKKEIVKQRWESLLKPDWPRISYTEAINIVQSVEHLSEKSWGEDLGSEHEKYLAGEYFKGPVFVTDYPKEMKPFYMKQNGDDKTVACFDLLVPEMGELIGGSLREDDYEKLVNRMQQDGMNLEEMEWYTDLRKQGSFPHGGYGMGFERFVCFNCGVDNIRDAIGFPRFAGSVTC